MDSIEGMMTDVVVDMENGSTTSSDDIEYQQDSKFVKNKCGRMLRGYAGSERYIKGEDNRKVSSCSDMCVGEFSGGNFETISDKWMRENMKRKLLDERYQEINIKKAAKPPRPPKGPSLNALDMKFAREVSELAMMKRARNERMKMLRQKKVDKGSSCLGSIFAMLITLIFCYVIIFQGLLGSRF